MRRWAPLAEVRDEHLAIRAALRRVDDLALVQSVGADAATFGRARQRLEATYLVRLVSAFEGILRAEFEESEDGLFLLIERAAVERAVPRDMAEAAHDVRRQRNRLVHPTRSALASSVPLESGFIALRLFVNRL